jgi:hypothetical protein
MEDIARQALQWNPQGKRGRGRPKNTWRRTVLEEAKGMKKTWAEIECDTKNRVQWRILVDALCSAAEWWDYWLIDITNCKLQQLPLYVHVIFSTCVHALFCTKAQWKLAFLPQNKCSILFFVLYANQTQCSFLRICKHIRLDDVKMSYLLKTANRNDVQNETCTRTTNIYT